MGFAAPFQLDIVTHRAYLHTRCRLDRWTGAPETRLLQDSTPAGPQALVIPCETWPHPSLVTGGLTPHFSDVSTSSPYETVVSHGPPPHSIYPLPPQPRSSNVVEIPVILREWNFRGTTIALLQWPYTFSSSFLFFSYHGLYL